MAIARCAVCDRFFTSVSAFEKHIVVEYLDHAPGYESECLSPASLGMAVRQRKWGEHTVEAWTQPMPKSVFEKMREDRDQE